MMWRPLVTSGWKGALDLQGAALCPGLLRQVPWEHLEGSSVLSQTPPRGSEAHLSAETPEIVQIAFPLSSWISLLFMNRRLF